MMNGDADLRFGVEGHTTIAFLKKQPGFLAAKNGDLTAARRVVAACVKPERIQSFRRRYADCAVLTAETKNRLPTAFAMALGLPLAKPVRALSCGRKSMSAMERILNPPEFYGDVARGRYILADDVLTTGGAMNALRKYVAERGGTPVAGTVLAFAAGGGAFEPDSTEINRLYQKFGADLGDILRLLGGVPDPQNMTRSQIIYLLKFSSAQRVFTRAERVRCGA